MLKTTSVIIAVLLSSAAHANGEGDGSYTGSVMRGTSAAYTLHANGIPYVAPFVSSRTARKSRPNFQPGPFHEIGVDDKAGR